KKPAVGRLALSLSIPSIAQKRTRDLEEMVAVDHIELAELVQKLHSLTRIADLSFIPHVAVAISNSDEDASYCFSSRFSHIFQFLFRRDLRKQLGSEVSLYPSPEQQQLEAGLPLPQL